MRLRTGRKNAQTARNLYLQLGDEPHDDDEYIGVIFDPVRAKLIAEIVNGERPAFRDRVAWS